VLLVNVEVNVEVTEEVIVDEVVVAVDEADATLSGRLPLRDINNEIASASERGVTKAVVRTRIQRTIAREKNLGMPTGEATKDQTVMSEVVHFLKRSDIART